MIGYATVGTNDLDRARPLEQPEVQREEAPQHVGAQPVQVALAFLAHASHGKGWNMIGS